MASVSSRLFCYKFSKQKISHLYGFANLSRKLALVSNDNKLPLHLSIERASDLAKEYEKEVSEVEKLWTKNNEIYYGKERDFKNFPAPKYQEHQPLLRHAVVPETFFQFFHKRTGESECGENLDKIIQSAQEEIQRVVSIPVVYQAKEENIQLQLELNYRERVLEAYKAVQRRLDYLYERELSQIRFKEQYMLNWIMDNVTKNITPQQEKETMNQCINDLKRLAQTYKTSLAI